MALRPTVARITQRVRDPELARYALEHPEEVIGGVYGVALGPVAAKEAGKQLAATSAVATQRAFEAGKAAGAGMWGGYGMTPPENAAVAEFWGPDDEKTCPLCRMLLGARFRVGSNEYHKFMPPVHINCVPAGTRVLTRDGWRPIEQITVGTEVLGHDGEWHRVTETMSREVDEDIVELEAEGGHTLRLTADHPVLTDSGWKPAGNVVCDDALISGDAAQQGHVRAVSTGYMPYRGEVYNIAVEDAESYVAEGIVVHNCRHVYVYYAADEPQAQEVGEFEPPPEEIVDRHGHFVSKPQKYRDLRVPATPEGRDFIVRRVKDPRTGEIVTRIDFLKMPETLPTAEARQTLVSLLDRAVTLPAPDVEAFIAANDLAPLVDHGWMRVVQVLGEPRTTVVGASSEAAARTALLREHPTAVVEAIDNIGATRIGARIVPQWQAVYRERDARQLRLTRRGRIAALHFRSAEVGE